MDIGKILENVTQFLTKTYLFLFAVLAAFLLFAPVDLLEAWGLLTYLDRYRPIAAVVFIETT